MSVDDVLKDRGIDEVLHFTTNRGLVGILATGYLRSRRRLNVDEYLKNILHQNAIVRPEEALDFDKSEDWLDYVNFSITAINASYMGFSKGWKHNAEIWWYVLAFDANIMSDNGAYFATTNNGYPFCIRGKEASGLNALFVPEVRRKNTWRAYRGSRASNLPTCQQAELLYPGEVSIEHLRKIYVRTEQDSDRARSWLRMFEVDHVEVVLCKDVFMGKPN